MKVGNLVFTDGAAVQLGRLIDLGVEYLEKQLAPPEKRQASSLADFKVELGELEEALYDLTRIETEHNVYGTTAPKARAILERLYQVVAKEAQLTIEVGDA